jgi:NADH:ubiquinone oxidoreductase subunit F (NADH-binding)
MDSPIERRLVLKNYGKIDPASLADYIAQGGFDALKKALAMKPGDIIRELKISGLRGRGGAGFPTGSKWDLTAAVQADQKYIICNADEGEPATYKDRLIMDEDPHLLIEALIIAGYTVDATKGYIYVRGEYQQSEESLKRAIDNVKAAGFMGQDILKSGFDFDLEVRSGGFAFVCGEETALIESIEGKRGEPRFRPPYPGVSGLWGKPTLVNNVETLANIPGIILNGGEWFSQIGAVKYPGTKIMTLSGDIANKTFVEVPTDTLLREIISIAGGGVSGGKFQAVQVGGNSGGILPESLLDTPIDFESMTAAGGALGTGAVFVINDTHDLLDVVRCMMEFFQYESCGKCTPCREGCKRLCDFMTKLCEGKATKKDAEIVVSLAEVMNKTALCGLGQAAPTAIQTTMKFFGEKYEVKYAQP